MTSLIDTINHPKAIWYWVGNLRLWYLPYVSTPTRIRAAVWQFGGGTDIEVSLKKTAHVLFYGANEHTGNLPILFLSECAEHNVGVTIHSNHVAEPLVLYRSNTNDRDDLLTSQILTRQNEKKRSYIARTIVRWQMHQREWLAPSYMDLTKLSACRTVIDVMQIEAQAARTYWSNFFRKLGIAGVSRRDTHAVNAALDALSHFLSGITMRWVISHGLSPSHGFLHRKTSYCALVDDLIETNRGWIEQIVFNEYKDGGEENLTARATSAFKKSMSEQTHTEPTRQIVYKRSLIQGSVIALRHYLDGRMARYMPPIQQDEKQRGRKRTTSYQLPGQIWQK